MVAKSPAKMSVSSLTSMSEPDEFRAEDGAMSDSCPMDLIRNIGIIAHIDAGKTTLTERVLYLTGRTYKVGEVHEGTAVMDWMDLERERGVTITAAATSCSWLGHSISIIDTPGHVDFTAEVERSLRVLDGGVVVFDATAGVEPQSETVWHQADKYGVPRICFMNKMDRPEADFYHAVHTIETRLGSKPLPLQAPLGEGKSFTGIVDLVTNKAWTFSDSIEASPTSGDIPDEYRSITEKLRERLLEKLAENDESFLDIYVEGSTLTHSDIRAAIRRVTLANKLVPVLCGTAFRNKGIQPLLDAVVNYLPSPSDVLPVQGSNPRTGEVMVRPADETEPFSALAFKVATDPFVGRLVYIRVYSGKVRASAQVLNSTRNQKERLGRLLRMHANRREEITEVSAGGIVGVLGLKSTFTGDTVCDIRAPILLESIQFPNPVVSVAIEPRTRVDQDRIVDALTKLAEEDPTFKVNYDSEMGQTLISGMGELHLEILTQRLQRDFGVDAKIGKPQVAYKETITRQVQSEGRFIKQFGGRGQYGHVWIELEPGERGSGFQFVDRIRDASIPKAFISSVKAGIEEALETGGPSGYPLVDIKAVLYDGSSHQVDSSEVAFKMAGAIALREGVRQADPALLEPIMRLHVTTPEEFLGDILGDLQARRAQIEGIEVQDGIRTVAAFIPLAEAFGYATDLRSLSEGRASHSMEFHNYQELPTSTVKQSTGSLDRTR
jgi:elongation factor G